MSLLSRPRLGAQARAANQGEAVVVSGLVAGAAYAVVQELDLRLTGRNVDDLAALGRLVVRQQGPARMVGLALHLVNSVILALIYAKVQPKLPGPPAVRGALFATIENCLLYPVTLFEDNHPGIRDGSIARYWNWPAFVQSVPRHLAYGAVLGVLLHRLSKR